VKKITRQKVQIQRDKLIQSGMQVIKKIDKRQFLEFEFFNEEGTGLAPTLEFYDNIANEFKNWSTKVVKDGKERKVAMW
jgi:E3 ubiquitin-protein ligase TRIP12